MNAKEFTNMPPEQKHKYAQQVMTDEEFNKSLEKLVDDIMNDEKDAKGIQPRMFMLAKSDFDSPLEGGAVMFSELPEPGERGKFFFGLGMNLAKEHFFNPGHVSQQPVAAWFISEAWMLKHELDDNKQFVHEHGDKVESVVVIGRTVDGRENMAIFEMHRDDEDKMNLKLSMLREYRFGSKAETQDNLVSAFFKGVAEYRMNGEKRAQVPKMNRQGLADNKPKDNNNSNDSRI